MFEYLFHDNVEPRPDYALQSSEISFGISEAVDVIDTQSVDALFSDQAENDPVGSLEHIGIFDADARQAGNVEEPAVVEVALGSAPKRKPIRLLF